MIGNNFFVITGGPGSGKSCIIKELQKRGYNCIEEVARQIIKEEMANDGDAVPWKNTKKFKDMMLLRTIETYNLAMRNPLRITFFDRNVLDLIAYNRVTKTENSPELEITVLALHYNKKVFIAPPWKEIYCNDVERKQTYEEAVEVYNNCVKVYSEHGCELIEIPKDTVEKRVDFILSHIKS